MDNTHIPTIMYWLPVLGALGGSLITGAALYLTTLANRKSDERKHMNTLMVNAAVENWKTTFKASFEQKDKYIAPLDTHLLHMMKFCELFLNQKVDKDTVQKKMDELKVYVDEVFRVLDAREPGT